MLSTRTKPVRMLECNAPPMAARGHKSKSIGTLRAEALDRELAALRGEIRELELEREELGFKEELLQGICLSASQAVVVLDALPAPPRKSRGEEQLCEAKQAVKTIEDAISQLLTDWPETYDRISRFPAAQGPVCPSKPGTPPIRVQGLCDSPCHASMMDGHLLSVLLHAICSLRENLHLAAAVKAQQHDLRGDLGSVQEDVMALLSHYSSTTSTSQRVAVIEEMASRIMSSVTVVSGACFLCPLSLYAAQATPRDPLNSKDRSLGLPSESAMDLAMEAMGMSSEQCIRILQGLSIFQELQAPLSKAKVAACTKLSQLLATSKAAHAPVDGDASTRAQEEVEVVGLMSQLRFSEHSAIDSLTQELHSISSTMSWLDHCGAWFGMGQLTWLQLAHFNAAMYPHFPLLGLMFRRLVTRTSLPLLKAVVLPGCGAVPSGRPPAAAAAAGRGARHGCPPAHQHRSHMCLEQQPGPTLQHTRPPTWAQQEQQNSQQQQTSGAAAAAAADEGRGAKSASAPAIMSWDEAADVDYLLDSLMGYLNKC